MAQYTLNNLETLDFHNFADDLEHLPAVPATISFKVQWSGVKQRFPLIDPATGFRGEFINTAATMEWSAVEANLVLFSDPAATSHSVTAVLGQEFNGVFF